MPYSSDADFLLGALQKLCAIAAPARILDFGCGSGWLVRTLREAGHEAWGCDNGMYRSGDFAVSDRIRQIETVPYRLPFDDAFFDAVISTSVLEHAQNKDEIFREIHRVLRPGGAMLHLFPGKFYLPVEPHIYIPFVSWIWPHVPRWWLALWSILGVRNEHRKDFGWRRNYEADVRFCRNNLSYWTAGQYRRVVMPIFGNCTFPSRFYLDHAPGGAARLARKLPFKMGIAWLVARVRMTVLLATKPP